MRNETVATLGGRRVVLMDSISLIGPQDAGTLIVCGSHGGLISGAFASLYPPRLVLFNDAGGGKNGAGRASLSMLDERGIAAATIGHDSARIGDALDAWEEGVISETGNAARLLGLRPRQAVKEAITRAAGV